MKRLDIYLCIPLLMSAGVLRAQGPYNKPVQREAASKLSCGSNIVITGTYAATLTESLNWIASGGITVIPAPFTVKLDADPVSGYVELNPGFETQAGATFVAEALDGCGAGVPMRPGGVPITAADDKKQEEKAVPGSLLVYPNPTGGKAVIQHPSTVKQLQVYGPTGKVLATINNPGGTTTLIDLGREPAGVYIIRADGRAAGKIVKQ